MIDSVVSTLYNDLLVAVISKHCFNILYAGWFDCTLHCQLDGTWTSCKTTTSNEIHRCQYQSEGMSDTSNTKICNWLLALIIPMIVVTQHGIIMKYSFLHMCITTC